MLNVKNITAIIIIYNEEIKIEDCLKTIHDFDQIIVIHDGECSDRSLEIASKYTDDIYVLPHK